MDTVLLGTIKIVLLGFHLKLSIVGSDLTGGRICLRHDGNQSVKACCAGYFERSGICFECPAGTFGVDCTAVCDKDHYGMGCLKMCNCTSEEVCHPETGCHNKLDIKLHYTTNKTENTETDETNSPVPGLTPYSLNIQGETFTLPELIIISLLVLIVILIASHMALGRTRAAKAKLHAYLEEGVHRRRHTQQVPTRIFSDEWSDVDTENPAAERETCRKSAYRSLANDNPYSNFEETTQV